LGYIVREEFMLTQYFVFLYIQAQNVARLLWTSLPFRLFAVISEAPPCLLQLATIPRLLDTLRLLACDQRCRLLEAILCYFRTISAL